MDDSIIAVDEASMAFRGVVMTARSNENGHIVILHPSTTFAGPIISYREGIKQSFDILAVMMCSWDYFVDSESIVRLIDAFVNSLNLTEYGVKEASGGGRPLYDPKGMYKLYIYGNRKGIRGETPGKILEITADKGYENEADMVGHGRRNHSACNHGGWQRRI